MKKNEKQKDITMTATKKLCHFLVAVFFIMPDVFFFYSGVYFSYFFPSSLLFISLAFCFPLLSGSIRHNENLSTMADYIIY